MDWIYLSAILPVGAIAFLIAVWGYSKGHRDGLKEGHQIGYRRGSQQIKL